MAKMQGYDPKELVFGHTGKKDPSSLGPRHPDNPLPSGSRLIVDGNSKVVARAPSHKLIRGKGVPDMGGVGR